MVSSSPPSLSYHTDATKIRLKSILEAQSNFGSTVGAAIVFYTGGFVYALIEIQSTYGISSTAHRLAFGMFWMIIPHVAVVSGVVPASNSPPTSLMHTRKKLAFPQRQSLSGRSAVTRALRF
ncbi:hypothetical protein K505DRAFT_359746 [Melanomma pulvis-pyrius CBS 109.77]|uniref:Uncharacterized protein n=1 Tax=Melanomma pulvis-pyrius CBS 109.77 TaxID=1314802 RepID=A0A6A6XHQ1_9PLEO|nr:hypothetical protein K505DRAFT_359746 [Melanomma pulvis-pyrius CBS 109.77]